MVETRNPFSFLARFPWRPRVVTSALAAVAIQVGCTERAGTTAQSRGPVTADVKVRDIRVLIVEDAAGVSVRIDGPYLIRSPAGGVLVESADLPRSELRAVRRAFTLGPSRWRDPIIEIVPLPGSTLRVSKGGGGRGSAPAQYAGYLRCLRRSEAAMDVVNVVEVETYLVGVLARELYATFHRETFRAQAVAARTYALFEMARNAGREYDVRATEASQVYGGVPTGAGGRRAQEAVRSTRGVICTWLAPEGERVFCTYYGSACGGLTQDVSNVMRTESIRPLSGGVRCDYCRIAVPNVYRWGPVSMTKRQLTRKLTERYPALAALGTIDEVRVSRRTEDGRPVRIRLVGRSGVAKGMAAEDFRLAVGSRLMRSTDCRIVTRRDNVRFLDGRGFGHGIGLCQWGAEGQARLGRRAGEVLRFYYPGAHLTRLY